MICISLLVVLLIVVVCNPRLAEWLRRMLLRDRVAPDKADSTPDNGDHKNPADNKEPEADYSGLATRDLLMAVLANLNCKVDVDDDDPERFYFTFQGETFCSNATNDCLMATIYDFSWGSVNVEDIDEVSNLRKAINTTNLSCGLCVMYTIDTEHNRMMVHTKRQILLVPEIRNIEQYVMAMLTGFFEVHRMLGHELDKLREGGK